MNGDGRQDLYVVRNDALPTRPTSYGAYEVSGSTFAPVGDPYLEPSAGGGGRCLPGRAQGTFEIGTGNDGMDVVDGAGPGTDGFDDLIYGVPPSQGAGGLVVLVHSDGAPLAEGSADVLTEWCLDTTVRLGHGVALVADVGEGTPAVAATLNIGPSNAAVGLALLPVAPPSGSTPLDPEAEASLWITLHQVDQGASDGGTVGAVDRDGDGVYAVAFGTEGDGYDAENVYLLAEQTSGAFDYVNADIAIETTFRGTDAGPTYGGTGFRCGAAPIAAADLDGDGHEELVLGFGKDRRVAVVDGGASLNSVQIAADLPTGAFGADDCFGQLIDVLGDVSGDGAAEIAVAAPRGRGGAWIFDGYALANGLVDAASDARVTITPRDGAPGNAPLGTTLVGGGDLDGDGIPDLVVGEGQGANRLYLHPGNEL